MGSYMSRKKMIKIDPDNGIVKELRKRGDADQNDKIVKDMVFETSLLTSRFSEDLNLGVFTV